MKTLGIHGSLLVACLSCALGCGSNTARQEFMPEESAGGDFASFEGAQNSPAPRQQMTRASTGNMSRATVLSVLDAGLGRFLQGVRVDAVQEDGHFVGFRVLELYSQDPDFQRVDLVPGDVVTAINTLSIERPENALRAFESLRTAPALVVDYLRNGESRRLNFTIED